MIGFTYADTANESKKDFLSDNDLSPPTDVCSGSTDNASVLRVIGSLLLGEAGSLAHYQIAKRGVVFGTT